MKKRVTVCDEAGAPRCPVFPGVTKRLHRNFPDPSQITGSDKFKIADTRRIRDLIKTKVSSWCSEVCEIAGPIA
jgi:arsenate reductase (thioredoxin)